MTTITIPGSRAGRVVMNMTRAVFPALDAGIVGRAARVAYQHVLDNQAVDTGTLVASTNVSPGEAVGLGLEYRHGHVPQPVTIIDQALAARRPWEPLVMSEDTEYGGIVESRVGAFTGARAAMRAAAPQIFLQAAAEAVQEALDRRAA